MNKIIQINGKYYSVWKCNSQPATMYIWAAEHVVPRIQWADFQAQATLITKMKPDAVLHEFFLDVIYDPKTQSYTKRGTGQPAINFKRDLENDDGILLEERATRDLANTLGHLVIGCDSRADQYHMVSDEEREVEQADVIEAYNGTHARPRVAVIGASHCSLESNLNRLLQQKKIDYAIIEKIETSRVMQLV